MSSKLTKGSRYCKKKTKMKPRDLKLDAEILSQKITLINEFVQNIESEK